MIDEIREIFPDARIHGATPEYAARSTKAEKKRMPAWEFYCKTRMGYREAL